MTNQQAGYVYILTNPCFIKQWIKIGTSKNPIGQQFNQLTSNTGVPLPFEIYATLKTKRYTEAGRLVYDYIDNLNNNTRHQPRRKFFNLSAEMALEVFKEVAKNLPDAEIMLYKDNQPDKKVEF